MSRNIKEIGKELMGKSLNSFHRKTGLTQLEKNNEMQDGILDGILSQVDDAYIEKTEQSNVIYLDGSGDGVVVLDGIEGNTMVNILNRDAMKNYLTTVGAGENLTQYNNGLKITSTQSNDGTYKFKCKFTLDKSLNGRSFVVKYDNPYPEKIKMCIYNNTLGQIETSYTNTNPIKITLPNDDATRMIYFDLGNGVEGTNSQTTYIIDNIMFLADYDVNKTIPPYFEGLQSSFEEKVNSEGKHEIEILSKNRNLLSKDSWQLNDSTLVSETKDEIVTKGKNNIGGGIRFTLKNLKEGRYCFSISAKTNTQGDGSVRIYNETKKQYIAVHLIPLETSLTYKTGFFTIPKDYERDEILIWIGKNSNYELETQFTLKKDFMLTRVSADVSLPYEEQKQNKIKLLLDEPLRSLPNGAKDRLCIKGGKLVVEKNVVQVIIDDKIEWNNSSWNNDDSKKHFFITASRENFRKHLKYDIVDCLKSTDSAISDKMLCRSVTLWTCDERMFAINGNDTYDLQIGLLKSELSQLNAQGVKTYFTNNPMKLCIQCKEPVYEEVLNEYGEPIMLEGYENGTIYIDSTIVPTTTVRYTPKMESFKTLKEVNDNNIMLTNDVNDNIIPYMMDVDLMIMEKEMALMSHQYKLRRTGEKDMTSMQKRTQDMLTRLIKGKTLTEQECKTRVVTYLDAGKITDAQADELMLLISEVYA